MSRLVAVFAELLAQHTGEHLKLQVLLAVGVLVSLALQNPFDQLHSLVYGLVRVGLQVDVKPVLLVSSVAPAPVGPPPTYRYFAPTFRLQLLLGHTLRPQDLSDVVCVIQR